MKLTLQEKKVSIKNNQSQFIIKNSLVYIKIYDHKQQSIVLKIIKNNYKNRNNNLVIKI